MTGSPRGLKLGAAGDSRRATVRRRKQLVTVSLAHRYDGAIVTEVVMRLKGFVVCNDAWGPSPDVVDLQGVRELAAIFNLDPAEVQKRYYPKAGLYYGTELVAVLRTFQGELRTDQEGTVLVLDTGAVLGPADLDAYQVVHATGSEMAWAAGGPGRE